MGNTIQENALCSFSGMRGAFSGEVASTAGSKVLSDFKRCTPTFCTGNIQAKGVNDDFLLVEALFCSVRSRQQVAQRLTGSALGCRVLPPADLSRSQHRMR